MNREGRDNHIPQAIFGPKVMLISEYWLRRCVALDVQAAAFDL
jgi:hypothetical protein